MAYDEALAERVRAVLADEAPTERRMFGGLGFLVGGHMAVCVSGQGEGLLVRVPEADGEQLVATSEHVAWMAMGERTARTWVHVSGPGVASDEDLAAWVDRGLGVVRTLPPK